jgi:hypothetical protein
MDIDKLKKFEKLPPDVKRQLALYMAKWKDKKKEHEIRNDFMAFVKHVWPDFVEGTHHKKVAKKFNDIVNVLLSTWHLDIRSLNLHLTYYLRGWLAEILN